MWHNSLHDNRTRFATPLSATPPQRQNAHRRSRQGRRSKRDRVGSRYSSCESYVSEGRDLEEARAPTCLGSPTEGSRSPARAPPGARTGRGHRDASRRRTTSARCAVGLVAQVVVVFFQPHDQLRQDAQDAGIALLEFPSPVMEPREQLLAFASRQRPEPFCRRQGDLPLREAQR
jgi:hypothetical protein